MKNHVKPAKQTDKKNLMRFFSVPDDAVEFYNDIFISNELPEDDENNFTNEDGIPIYEQNSTY